MSERKIVEAIIKDESFYYLLDGKTPDDVGVLLHEFKTSYEGRDIFFKVRGFGYDGGLDLELWERRPETDREYEKRLTEEKKEQEKKALLDKKKKDQEYKEYLRLKKKFGAKE